MNNSKTIKEIILTVLNFLQKYIFVPVQVIVAIVTIFIMVKANTITNIANLIQINDTIQRRTDIVIAVNMRIEEYVKLTVNSNDPIDDDKGDSLDFERNIAIRSLLNAYDFACDQYKKNKIDKEAFKTFYFYLIEDIREKYSPYFNPEDGKAPYQAINDVYREWHVK